MNNYNLLTFLLLAAMSQRHWCEVNFLQLAFGRELVSKIVELLIKWKFMKNEQTMGAKLKEGRN